MPGTLVPPWYSAPVPRQEDVILSTFLWGFAMSLAIFAAGKALSQTYRSWKRRRWFNFYIMLVWLLWATGFVMAIVCWFYIMNWIKPSLWFFLGILIMWTIQLQCLTQILANRVSLILYDPDKARKLKLGVALAIGIINVSVFVVWIPARLQISERWMIANNIWDRAEKCIFLIIDLTLNAYFMWLVKIKLIANGLTRYRLIYRCNLLMVCLSIIIDAAIIGIMSLPDNTVYIQAHALAYMMKLYIEMNLAELIGKVIKKSNQRRNSYTAPDGWEPSQTGEVFNREWRDTVKKILQPTGGQMHDLDTNALHSACAKVTCPAEAHCRKGSGSRWEPLAHQSTRTCSARRGEAMTV